MICQSAHLAERFEPSHAGCRLKRIGLAKRRNCAIKLELQKAMMNAAKKFALPAIGLFGVVQFSFAQTWTQTSAPSNQWRSITCSADGIRLAACMTVSGFTNGGAIYLSTNSGNTWIVSSAPTNFPWFSIASSADGKKLVAAGWGQNQSVPIYTSTNFGATWISNNISSTSWYAVLSSADGVKLAAVINNGGIYTSTNSGSTWTKTGAPNNYWQSIASSADGSKLVAVGLVQSQSVPIYTSTNFGATWTPIGTTPNLSLFAQPDIASSTDGTKLAL